MIVLVSARALCTKTRERHGVAAKARGSCSSLRAPQRTDAARKQRVAGNAPFASRASRGMPCFALGTQLGAAGRSWAQPSCAGWSRRAAPARHDDNLTQTVTLARLLACHRSPMLMPRCSRSPSRRLLALADGGELGHVTMIT